ncbi:hypothetical protein CPB86DRAFT_748379 [Serendipita vermifera]|nr:hypothetical protein CPB86DRAFT_748379 [Serendipita vermifera]
MSISIALMIDSIQLDKQNGEERVEEELQRVKDKQLVEVWQAKSSSTGTEVQLEFDEKVRQYNFAVDALNKLRDSRRSDPICKLPSELCHQILSDAASGGSELVTRETLMTWTLVARLWMDFIIRNPLYWTNVYIDRKLRDWYPKALLCLHLSRELPLTLHIKSLEKWEIIEPELQSHLHRVERIVIRMRSTWYSYSPEAAVVREFIEKIPRVIEIFAQPLEFTKYSLLDLIHWNPGRDWRRIEFSSPLTTSLENLEAIPSLKTVECSSFWPHPEQDSPELEKGKALGWKQLVCKQLFPTRLIGRLTALVSLTLRTAITSTATFLEQVHVLSNLSDLDWTIEYYWIDKDVKDTKLNSLSSMSFSPNRAITTLNLDTSRVRLSSAFTESIKQTFPCVKLLELTPGTSLEVSDFLGSKSFQETRTVKLHCIPCSSRIHIEKLLPCDIVTLPSIDQFCHHFSGQSVKRLVVHYTQKETQIVVFEPTSWPCIESLQIPASSILGSNMGFPYLRELTLFTPRLKVDPNVTKFCTLLALDPSKCPALESLNFSRLPELDIFFIMLENRNLRNTHGSKPLKNLGVPDCSSQHILRHVRDILRGKIPIRPSNFELSFLGSMDMILDPTIPDCLMCILAQIRCVPVPVKEIEWRQNIARNRTIPSYDLPLYPNEEIAVLSSWEERFNQCKALAKAVSSRKEVCTWRRWSRNLDLIQIDCYSSIETLYLDILIYAIIYFRGQ